MFRKLFLILMFIRSKYVTKRRLKILTAVLAIPSSVRTELGTG